MRSPAHDASTQQLAEAGVPPTVRHGLTSGPTDPAAQHWVLLRPSLAIKLHLGPWYLDEGEVLEGTLIRHPINISRKIIIQTTRGTFNVNEEDVAEVSNVEPT
jgi:hypothetical protein